MVSIAKLVANVIADTSDFEAGLKRSKNQLDSFGAGLNKSLSVVDKSFKGLSGSVQKFGGDIFSIKGAMAAVIGTVGGGGLVMMAKSAIDMVGSLGEVAQQLGVTTDTLQAFRYAATQVGLSQDEMDGGLAKLTKTIGMAAEGNKTAIDTFNGLGIKIVDANGNIRSTDDIVREAADAIAGMSDPAKRAAASVDLMGKAGQRMLPFLEGGAAGINAFIQQAKDLGLVFDEDTIRRADETSDKLATMAVVIGTKLSAALVQAAPLFSAFADNVIELIGNVQKFYDTFQQNDMKSTPGLVERLNNVTKLRDQLQATIDLQKNSGIGFLGDWLGGNSAQSKKLADYNAEIAAVQKLIRARRDAVQPVLGTAKGGTSNPTATQTGKTQEQKDAEAALKSITDLQFKLDQLSRSGLDQAVADALKGFKGTPEQAAQVAAIATQTYEQAEAQKELNEELAAEDKIMQDGKATHESLLTANEKYEETLRSLGEQLDAGAISQEDWNRGMLAAQKVYEDSDPLIKSLRDNAADLGSEIGTAFEDAVLQGKSLQEVLQGLLQDVSRLLLRIGEKQAENWFADILGQAPSWFGGLFGGGTTLNGVPLGHADGGLIMGPGGPRQDKILSALSDGEFVVNAAATRKNLGLLQAINAGQLARFADGGMVGSVPSVSDGSVGQAGVVLAPMFNLNSSGGTPEQNRDMVAQFTKQIIPQMRQLIQSEIGRQKRGGGMLNPGIGGA